MDKQEVELKIRTVINFWEEQPLINDDQIEELIDLYYEICKLQPKYLDEKEVKKIIDKFLTLSNTNFIALDVKETPENVLNRVKCSLVAEICKLPKNQKVIAEGKITHDFTGWKIGDKYINALDVICNLGLYENWTKVKIILEEIK